MANFHHIGLFVKNIEYGLNKLSELIDIKEVEDKIVDDELCVIVLFVLDCDGVRYELVAPNGLDNPVDGVLNSKKNILNHIAYTSMSFDEDILNLRDKGCIPLGPTKKAKAFSGARVIFFYTLRFYL